MITEIRNFVMNPVIDDSIGRMEERLDKAKGYSQYVGEMVNQLEQELLEEKQAAVEKFANDDSMTETLRKTKIEAQTAPKKHALADAKLLYHNLRSCTMTLMMAIKTRRIEPH